MATGLRRELGLPTATSLVVGSMIGSGIFLGVQDIALLVRDPWVVLAVFLVSGILVVLGALTYGELAAMYPTSGGHYVYIRESYGPLVGFLQGWSIFTVAKSASLAALGVAFAIYLGAFVELAPWAAKAVAVALIVGLSAVNVLGVRYGGWIANASAVAKVGALAALVLLGLLLFGRAERVGLPEAAPGGLGLVAAFGLAMVPAMFAYDGWINSTQVAEEVRDPKRNVPRSLLLGVLVVMGVYLAVVFVYLLHLGVGGVAATGFAAAQAAESFAGPVGRDILVLAVLVSVAGTANAVILSGPRVMFAMARDGRFFPGIETVHPRYGTPARSIWLQAAWSSVLAVSGTFLGLLVTVIFVSWIWYGLGAFAVILERRRRPHAERPVKVPLYPWVPLLFVAATAVFTVNTLLERPLDSLLGVGIVLTGLPLYWWRARSAPRDPASAAAGRAVAPGGEPPAPPTRAALVPAPPRPHDAESLRAAVLAAAKERARRGEPWSTEDVARALGADVGAVYAALAGLAGDELELTYEGARLVVRAAARARRPK